jgi:hypothetical protein
MTNAQPLSYLVLVNVTLRIIWYRILRGYLAQGKSFDKRRKWIQIGSEEASALQR